VVGAPRISSQSAHEGGTIVSPMQRPPSSLGDILVLISVGGRVDLRAIERSMGLVNEKSQLPDQELNP